MAATATLPGLPNVTIASWSGRTMPEEELRDSLAFLAHKVKKPVHMQAYDGAAHYSEGLINVYVCTGEACTWPRNVGCITISGETHSLEASQRFFPANPIPGEPIADDNQCMLAKVDHNCITFVAEFTAVDNDAGRAILAHVIEQAIPLLNFDVGDLVSEERDQMFQLYREFHLAAIKRHIQDKTDALRQMEFEAEDYYRRLVQAERDMPVLRTELDALQQNAKNTEDGAVKKQAADLCTLISSGQYEEIKPQPDGGLSARTSAITIWHDDWEFSLGCYDIKVDCHGKVTIRSADGTDAQGYPHPHIDSSGKPCLGNIAPDLARAIGRMRIAEALSLLHEFLTSYNPDNPYIKLSRFDPDYSGDEDENPCEDCDESCTPYCIMDCPHNEGSAYSCSDCCDYRTDFCYGECERNRDYDYVNPCHNCEEEKDHCFLECPWNKEWNLSNPCEECESDECDDECGYFAKRQELSFQKGGPNAGREQPQPAPAAS
jgi:hypothetical protein